MNLWSFLGFFIVLAPVCFPFRLKSEWPRNFAFALITLLLCSTVSRRVIVPYEWHSYRAPSLFAKRRWFRHPQYGPMVADSSLLQFIQPVCKIVNQNGAKDELLSLPFPFANYFCATPPWHGYVQTFFDISDPQTIVKLKNDLQVSPPEWILYQKQMFNLGMHEKVFNHGNPLPHRALYEFIDQKIARHEWQVVYTSDYLDAPVWDNHWLLIHTR